MPDLIYKYVVAMLLGLALGFTGAWKIQNWRVQANENERIALQATQERELHVLEQKRSANVIDAQNAASARAAGLRADAARSRAAVDELRLAADEALRAGRASHDACIDRATSISDVLAQCAGKYQALGEVADRHASDLKTVTDAWPK